MSSSQMPFSPVEAAVYPRDVEVDPLVSIVMPTYNRAALIVEAIASVIAQTYRNWELLIADDGSTDDTADRVRGFQDSRIVLLMQPRIGSAAAMRNRALAHAKGSLVAFLDSDDLWKPSKLQMQVRQLQARPEIGLLYSRAEVFNAGGVIEVMPRDSAAPQGQVFWRLSLGNFVPSSTVIVRASVLRETGLQCERAGISEDYEHWLRVARRFEFGFAPEVTAAYRKHDGNISANLVREAVRGRDALLLILDTVADSRWRGLLARAVAELRVFAVAADDAEVGVRDFAELLAARLNLPLVRRMAPGVRAVLRGVLRQRVRVEKIAALLMNSGLQQDRRTK